jgi:hypothetical protein
VPAEHERQRIDRWLWHARVVRTREAAASLAGAGYIRVNGARIDAPGRMVRTGEHGANGRCDHSGAGPARTGSQSDRIYCATGSRADRRVAI